MINEAFFETLLRISCFSCLPSVFEESSATLIRKSIVTAVDAQTFDLDEKGHHIP